MWLNFKSFFYSFGMLSWKWALYLDRLWAWNHVFPTLIALLRRDCAFILALSNFWFIKVVIFCLSKWACQNYRLTVCQGSHFLIHLDQQVLHLSSSFGFWFAGDPSGFSNLWNFNLFCFSGFVGSFEGVEWCWGSDAFWRWKRVGFKVFISFERRSGNLRSVKWGWMWSWIGT